MISSLVRDSKIEKIKKCSKNSKKLTEKKSTKISEKTLT